MKKHISIKFLFFLSLTVFCFYAQETVLGTEYRKASTEYFYGQVFLPPVNYVGPPIYVGPTVTTYYPPTYNSPVYVNPPVVVPGPVIVRYPWRPFWRTFIP